MKTQAIHHFTVSAVLMLSLLNPSVSQVDVTQLESRTAAILHDGHFPSENVGYLVGDMDSILKTEDQGASWTKIPVELEPAFTGVWFLDDTTGFIVGDTAVYSTSDGGATWGEVFSYSQGGLNQIAFLDDQVGVLTIIGKTSNESSIFHTEDGGATWKPSNIDSGTVARGIEPVRICFLSSTIAYIAARACLLVSEDMGKNWRVKTPAPNGGIINSLSFLSQDSGVIGSRYYGGIWIVDSGDSLKEVWRETITDMRMISSDQVLAISNYGKILTAVHLNGTVDTLWELPDPPLSGDPLQKFVPIKPGLDILIGSEGRMFKARYDETLGIRTGKISPAGSREGIKFSQENRFLLNREQDGKLRSYLINGALLPDPGSR